MDHFDRHYDLFSCFNVGLESPWDLEWLIEMRIDMREKIVKIINRVILVTAALLCFVIITNSGESIEEMLPRIEDKPIEVLHKEEVDQGTIIFYQHVGLENEDLSFAYFRKRLLGGFELLTSGTQEVSSGLNHHGISFTDMAEMNGEFPPICFGLIGEDEIVDVKVIEKSRCIEQEVKIIKSGDKRFWICELVDFQGTEWILIGLGNDRKEILRIENNV